MYLHTVKFNVGVVGAGTGADVAPAPQHWLNFYVYVTNENIPTLLINVFNYFILILRFLVYLLPDSQIRRRRSH
jgi:hypothetical protein